MKTLLCIVCLAAGLLQCSTAKEEKPMFGKVPDATLKEAEAFGHIRYDYKPDGGRHTGAAFVGGALVVQALAAWQGNEAADARLLEKVRNVLKPENSPLATGAYLAQHERLFTGAVLIMKHTPRVWAKLTDDEKTDIDLIIKACLVASAYTTSDYNYKDGARPYDMGGLQNFHRGWNPNFREGIIGGLLTGACWLGPKEAQAFLDSYNHEAFCKELEAAGVTNPLRTFTWKKDNPESNAPTAEMVNAALHGFRYKEKDLSDPMDLYEGLTRNTYDKHVNAGLNDGNGIDGSGRIASGAEELPNKGKHGMLKEFDARDANGARSSVGYAYDGFRPNLVNQISVIISGHWEPVRGNPLLDLLAVGIPDLFYKLGKGYINYAKGKASKKTTVLSDPQHDYRVMRSLWEDVVKPYHKM